MRTNIEENGSLAASAAFLPPCLLDGQFWLPPGKSKYGIGASSDWYNVMPARSDKGSKAMCTKAVHE